MAIMIFFEGRLFVIAHTHNVYASRARVSYRFLVGFVVWVIVRFVCRFFACSSKRYMQIGVYERADVGQLSNLRAQHTSRSERKTTQETCRKVN